MIEALRRRFVLISSVSVAAVFGLVFTVLFFVGTAQRDSTMDTLVDTVAAYGVDPSVGAQATVPLLPDINLDQSARPTSVTEQLDGRFFSVWVGTSGNALGLNVGDNSPVSTERAWHLAQSALLNGPERGWADGYRYLIQHSPDGVLVIFVNGEATMESTNQLLLVAAVVFLLSWALITALCGKAVAGWASMTCIVCFVSGVQLICLGIIGEYIGKIYMETKHRPRYIISERTWVHKPAEPGREE